MSSIQASPSPSPLNRYQIVLDLWAEMCYTERFTCVGEGVSAFGRTDNLNLYTLNRRGHTPSLGCYTFLHNSTLFYTHTHARHPGIRVQAPTHTHARHLTLKCFRHLTGHLAGHLTGHLAGPLRRLALVSE